MYAVNLCDLHALMSEAALRFVVPTLADGRPELVNVAPGYFDGMAIRCNAVNTQFAAISLRSLQSAAKQARKPMRIYQQGPRGAWKRVRTVAV